MSDIIIWTILSLFIIFIIIPVAIFQYTKMYYGAKQKAKMEFLNEIGGKNGKGEEEQG